MPHILLQQGWYQKATHHPSPNFSARSKRDSIDLIVIHSISLPPGQYGGSQVLDFFCNRLDTSAHPYFSTIATLQVSAHFFIQRNGKLTQLVSCDDKAWHAGVSEHLGRPNCNEFSIGIELEGLEHDHFEEVQYVRLCELIRDLAQHYPIRWVMGHEHIAPGRKQDPGQEFDWSRLCHTLGWSPSCFPLT